MKTRVGCLVLASMLAGTACAPQVVPASSPHPHLLLADAIPASAAASSGASPGPSAGAPSAAPSASTASASETAQGRESRQLGRTWGWAAISVGTAAGLIAIGTSGLMLSDASTRNSGCNAQKVCSPSGATANTALSDLAGWNTVSWVVAVAGLGIGAYLLITNPTDRAAGTKVGLAPNGSGLSLDVRSAF